MNNAVQIVQAFVVPIVVISANGLLCLALYNRLAAVVNRARTINKERFDVAHRLAAMAEERHSSLEALHLRERDEVLHELGHQLYDRSRMLRDSLIFLLITVLAMIGCSLSLGMMGLWAPFAWVALALFVTGMLVMLLGIVRAIQELLGALNPLIFEHEMMERQGMNNGSDV